MNPRPDGMALRSLTLALNTLGLLMMLSLPALWLALTPAMLLVTLGIGIAAGTLYCLLYAIEQRVLGVPASRVDPRSRILMDPDRAQPNVPALPGSRKRLTAPSPFARKIEALKRRLQSRS